MSNSYVGGTSSAVPVSPGTKLSTLFGYTGSVDVVGMLIAPTTNSGNLTIVKTVPTGSNTIIAPGAVTPIKPMNLDTITIFSANGTEVVTLDATHQSDSYAQ